MFVSRKNLPFIHLVPTEVPPRLHMLQPLHQSVELLRAAASCCELFQPFAEHSIERLMLRFGQEARLLNQLLIRTEGNVFHTEAVYTSFVWPPSLLLQANLVALCVLHSLSPWERFGKELQNVEHRLSRTESMGRMFFARSHNPKVGSSNLPPATKILFLQ
jgi:hypothetical protein